MSNKLGVLTLDLIAKVGKFIQPLKDAEKQSVTTFGEIKRGADKAAKAMPAMAAATVAALAAITTSHVQAANEIARLSNFADVNVVAFQKYGAGAQAVGIQYDKLADITKDVNEKMGEFAATGGGGAKDFFENIAPKVGVTIEQFQRLSGPEALQLYKDSLDAAKVPQQDQIFYLESLASDAKVLIPLLADGGKGFDTYAASVAASGAVMSEEAIAKAQTLTAVKGQLGNQLTGVKNQIAQAVVPTLIELGTAISGAGEQGANFINIGGVVHAVVSTIARVVLGAVTAFKVFGKALATVIGGLYQFQQNGFGAAYNFMSAGMEDISGTLSEAANQQERLAQGAGQTTQKIQTMADVTRLQGSYASNAGLAASTVAANNKRAADAAKAHQRAARRTNAALREQERLSKKAAQEAKRLADAYKQVKSDARSDEQKSSDTLNQRISVVRAYTAASITERKKLIDWAKAQYHEEAVNRLIADARMMQSAREYSQTRQAQLVEVYKIERAEIKNNSRLTKSQRDEMLTHLKNQANLELQVMKLNDDKKLSSLRSFNKSAIELIRERYEFERRQLAIDPNIGDAEKGKLLDAYNNKEAYEISELQRKQAKDFRRQGNELNGTSQGYQIDANKESQIEQLDDWLENEAITKEEHAERLLDIDRNYYAAKAELQANQMGNIAGSLTSITKNIFGEQSAAYRVMVGVEKGISIARSLMAIQTGIALAAANPFPMNLGAMASVASATASIVSQISSASAPSTPGFMSGGYTGNYGTSSIAGVVHGQEFVVNAPNTAKYRPQLEAMNKGTYSGSQEPVSITIINNGQPMQVERQEYVTPDQMNVYVSQQISRQVPAQIANSNSPIRKALKHHTNVTRSA